MAKKVYAIKEGFDSTSNQKIENKIVYSWADCLKYVKGVKGAKYKSFEDMDSAKQFLIEGCKMLRKGIDDYPKDCIHVYVDGSYNVTTEKYSYGVVAVRNDIVEYIESNAAKDNSKSNIRQIAGELEAAIKGVEYALSCNDKEVIIFHDYEGVAHHATGYWERREPSSVEYYKKMNELMNKGIEVIFVKVDSHTGDLYNELVDEMCKEKLEIQSDKTVEKWLNKQVINVASEEIKDQIINIAPSGINSIVVVGCYNKNNIKNDKADNIYDEIECKFNINKNEAKKLIDRLSSEEKTEYIINLIESRLK